MAFNLSNVLSSLSSTSIVFDDAAGEFKLIDVEEAKRELRLASRATDNGTKGVPGPEDLRKDAMAAEIDTYISHLILLAKNKFVDKVREADDLNDAQPQSSIQAITEIFENATSELKSVAKNYYNTLLAAKKEWVQGDNEFAVFREENKRIGPARYPDRKAKVYNVGWIFLIMLIEILFNAWVLGDAHPRGSVGVFVEILMFGVANVGAAFLLGCYVWRYFYHVDKIKRTIAAVLALPIIAVILFLNFLLAHYRDAISELAKDDIGASQTLEWMQRLGQHALGTLAENPFVMNDVKSYLLLIVGVIAAILAARKSFELDDPYPGYGKISREQKELDKNFNDEWAFAFKDMSDLIEDYSNQINSQLSLVESYELALNARERDKKQLFDKYNNWRIAIESVGGSLYAFYREENMKAREDQREPKCFSSINFVLSDDTKVNLDTPEPMISAYVAVEKACKEYIDNLNRQLDKFRNEFIKDIENISAD